MTLGELAVLWKEQLHGGWWCDWEIGIDIYTLICIKWITNKNLLYKKINKIKFKKKKKSSCMERTVQERTQLSAVSRWGDTASVLKREGCRGGSTASAV